MDSPSFLGHSLARACLGSLAATLMLMAGALGCHNAPPKPSEPAAALEVALFPAGFATRLAHLGRAHVHAVVRMTSTVDNGDSESVTTDTDVWSDETGNFRMVDSNDRDGGREVVHYGKELAVAMRYGKLIKRVAIEPEPTNLLGEGLSAPFAFFDLVRAGAIVDDMGDEKHASGRAVKVYKVSKQPKHQYYDVLPDAKGTRAWRKTITMEEVDATIKVDAATRVPLEGTMHAIYHMRRGANEDGKGDSKSEGVPMHGQIDVKLATSDIGTSPGIAPPEAEELPPRQRTVQEEKALLGGLATRGLGRKEKP